MNHKISEFNELDQTWLAKSQATGRRITQHFTQQNRPEITPQLLDQAFQKWAASPGPFSSEEIANGLGSLFAEFLRTRFPFTWKTVEDDFGCEPALIDESTGSIVFPVNAVFKRIEPEMQQEAFFKPMADAIASHLNSAS